MHMLCENKLGALGLLLSDSLESIGGDLSLSAAALLLSLFYNPGSTATELAKIVGVSQPTAVRVLDGLVERGLIKREDPSGRITLLGVTSAGRKSARKLQVRRLRAMKNLLNALTALERKNFERTLDKLLASSISSRAFARTTCRLCDHTLCDGPLCPVGTRATEIERRAQSLSKEK
jgi:DNA-binding MarR family transcriptional regulator